MNKTYGLAVVLITAAAMLLSAAGEQDSEMAADSDGGPQYGGTLTAVGGAFGFGPESPDPADNQGHTTLFLALIQERPRIGDHERVRSQGHRRVSLYPGRPAARQVRPRAAAGELGSHA